MRNNLASALTVCGFVAGLSVALQGQGAPPAVAAGAAPPPRGPSQAPAAKPVPPPSPKALERAALVLTAARQALGGEALAKVTTVVAEGRTRRVRGNNIQPIMASWQCSPTDVVVTAAGQPPPQTVAPGAVVVAAPAAPPASASQEERDSYAKDVPALRAKAQATPVEHRLYYADYREVDGVKCSTFSYQHAH